MSCIQPLCTINIKFKYTNTQNLFIMDILYNRSFGHAPFILVYGVICKMFIIKRTDGVPYINLPIMVMNNYTVATNNTI